MDTMWCTKKDFVDIKFLGRRKIILWFLRDYALVFLFCVYVVFLPQTKQQAGPRWVLSAVRANFSRNQAQILVVHQMRYVPQILFWGKYTNSIEKHTKTGSTDHVYPALQSLEPGGRGTNTFWSSNSFWTTYNYSRKNRPPKPLKICASFVLKNISSVDQSNRIWGDGGGSICTPVPPRI